MTRPSKPSAAKVVTLEALLERLRPLRKAGLRVVFTNGCYDLLHAGHLHLLESAASLGEVLVLGLNDDASVARLKGPGRPLIPFPERARLLGGLEVVDFVVGFAEDTPAEIIAAIRPDVLVKGGDWAPDRIVGRETVESGGGRVVTVPLHAGRSTSSLLEKIRGGGRSGEPGTPPPSPQAG